MATGELDQPVAGSHPTNGAAEPVLTRPIGLLAELTHRCPLGCPYCSNPLALDPRDRELDSQTWARVFGEAVALGMALAFDFAARLGLASGQDSHRVRRHLAAAALLPDAQSS